MKVRNAFFAIVALVLGALLVSGGVASAVDLIGSKQLERHAVISGKIAPGAANENKLSGAVKEKLNRSDFSELESDGPYPGATDLGDLKDQGDNSDDMWTNDGSRQTSWVECAPGKVALGGGYNLAADAGDAKAKDVQVVVSEPIGDAITGDKAGSILPYGWKVEGFYNGEGDVIVRPWVVCAKIAR